MKIIETKVYTFDELSDKAKEKARDWFRQGEFDYDWWDFIYEDASTIAKILGIEFKQVPVKLMNGSTRYDPAIYFSGFSSQGDGACFEGAYEYAKGAPAKIKKHAPTDAELSRIASGLQEIQKKNAYMLTASVTHFDRYYHKYSTTIEVMRGEESADAEAEETVMELLRDFMEWIYRTLEKEYEYRMSNEAVDDGITANEYTFTIDGERFGARV